MGHGQCEPVRWDAANFIVPASLGGGAARVWFMPGCLCFTFKCAGGYHLSPECQSLVQQVKERLHLQTVIRPLCLLIHDRGYEVVDGRFVRK